MQWFGHPDDSVAKSKSKTLVPNPARLNSIIVSLLNLTQIFPCLFLFPVDILEDLPVCQDDYYRCRANRYKNLVASVIIRFVVVSINFLYLKSAQHPDSMADVHSRAAATLPISWIVPNSAIAIPRFLGSKLLQLIHETMIGWELGVPIISVRIANLTQAYPCEGKSNSVTNRGISIKFGIVQWNAFSLKWPLLRVRTSTVMTRRKSDGMVRTLLSNLENPSCLRLSTRYWETGLLPT